MSELRFVGGISDTKKWIEDGKENSRNYRQGNRVYSADGLATALTAQPVGSYGGATSLYLVQEDSAELKSTPIAASEGNLVQIGFIKQNMQGYRVYDTNGVGATVAAQTGGLARAGGGLYLVHASDTYPEKFQQHSNNEPPQHNVTYASAFAGIGGMSLGLAPLGYHGVIAWEYDPTAKKRQYAQEAHKLLHPDIPVHGDVYEANTEEIPDFDVFCFTPPCQAFSLAGNRKGTTFICTKCQRTFIPEQLNLENLTLDCPTCTHLAVPEDDRGVLTYQAIRIAKDKQPKALFMENVKGLLSHDKGNTLYSILKAFNEIGYIVDFTILNSKYFDVAQNRERVYLIGLRKDLIEEETWRDTQGSTLLPKMKRYYTEKGINSFNFDWPPQEEVRTRLRDFLEPIVEERYYLSEEKTLQILEQINTNNARKSQVEDVTCINPRTATGSQTRQQERTYEVGGCMTTLQAQLGGRFNICLDDAAYRIRRLTPRECLRLQAVPEDAINLLSEHFSDSALYKFAGNGLTTNTIKAIGERLLPYITNN